MNWDASSRAATYLRQKLEDATAGGETDIARVFRKSQTQILSLLRYSFDQVFGEGEVSYTRAREVGMEALLRQGVVQAMDTLNADLDGIVITRLTGLMYQAVEEGAKALSLAEVPAVVTPELTPEDITTKLRVGWGGATAEDRLFHMTAQLQNSIVGSLRTGLLGQESYDDLRDRIIQQLGLGDLPSPPFSIYGSVKTWKNEARQAWNDMVGQVVQANAETSVVVWRSRLSPRTTPECADNHGKLIDEDLGGDIPPAHYNCECTLLFIPADKESQKPFLDRMAAERKAWQKAYAVRERAKAARKKARAKKKEGYFIYQTPVLREAVAWDPRKHPRGPGGRFGTSGLRRVLGQRVFDGDPVPTRRTLSKQETGALGEQIVLAFMRGTGVRDAAPLNTGQNNFPLDLGGDHLVVEVKAGLVSNGRSAQQWRLTLGEPGQKEKAWLARASPAQKAALNSGKEAAILQRKAMAISAIAKERGISVKGIRGITMGVIINPDTRTADLYHFQGFHANIQWRSPKTSAAYVTTVRYA